MAITAFSNFSITISDGGTVPSIDYLTNKTYVNIGSGNVFKISWSTPTAPNNAVDSYKLYIFEYDTASASYKPFYNINLGNVNEFYAKADLFNSMTHDFAKLQVYIEAISKYDSAYSCASNIAFINIAKGSGTYVRVEDVYKQPIMKRAIAFTKLDYKLFTAEDGTPFTSDDGKLVYIKRSSTQDDTIGWTLMQECYTKDANKNWQVSDIAYEALLDTEGELITDMNGDTIYVL